MQKKPSTPQESEEDQEINPESLINKVIYFPSGQHVWRQQGPYVVCNECILHHAVYVGMDKVMVGEKDGEPILRDKASI